MGVFPQGTEEEGIDMAWIDINEKTPDIGKYVLIYTPVKEDFIIEIAMFDVFKGFINPSMGYGYFKNVTHWMPLPNQPEYGGREE